MTHTLTMALPARHARSELDVEALYRACRDDVYAYVASMLRDAAAAEDVTAAAFERAFRRRATYRAGRGSERAWLYGIARNAALDELRHRKRSTALAGDVVDPAAIDPQVGAEAAVRRVAVRDAIAGLEPRDRELIALKFFAGLSNAELAAVVGVSESNAGTLLHRAVQRLRKACHETS